MRSGGIDGNGFAYVPPHCRQCHVHVVHFCGESRRAMLAELASREAAYKTRFVPIDAAITAEWARLLGAKDRNQRDRALVATARVNGFVPVTRNIDEVRGCGVLVLNPFDPNPVIRTV